MEKRKRKDYVAPVTESVECKTERILCESGVFEDYILGGDPFAG